MGTKITDLIDFLTHGIWRIRLDELPRKKSFLLRQLRIFLLTIRGFTDDKCKLRASALTFYTLLSIVPVIALAFAIAKGFGVQQIFETQLMERFTGHEEVIGKVMGFASGMIERTKGGTLAGIGIMVLLWAVLKVLNNIEHSFNDIWEIKKPRTFVRKLTDYLSIMLLAPVLIVISSSATVFVTTQVTLIVNKIEFLGFIAPLIFLFFKLTPYFLIWVLFTFIYVVMPNTKVNLKAGVLAGIVAGTLYQFAQWGFIHFQVGISRSNAIYGSFAALPLFLIWLEVSWLIVLFGAEYSFANQNVETYEFEHDCTNISHRFRKLLTLLISNLLIKRFCANEKPMTDADVSHELQMPVRLARQQLAELVESGLFHETSTDDEKTSVYLPSSDVGRYTVGYVLGTLNRSGSSDIPVVDNHEFRVLQTAMDKLEKELEESPSNRLLKDI